MTVNEDVQPRTSAQIARMAVFLLVALIASWPLMAGLRAANDDVKWVRTPDHELPVMEAIRLAWATEASFRPLEVFVGHWCDPETLKCGVAIAVQAAGLLLLMLGVTRLCRICMPQFPAAGVVASGFLAISPATTCSVWQVDSCSQTWTAALGAWVIIECLQVLDAAHEGRVNWRGNAWLCVLFIVGCSLKETFYGWSAGIGTACAVAVVGMATRDRAASLRSLWLFLPTIVLPIAHLGLRLSMGALSQRMHDEEGSRYQVEIGMNLIINSAMSLAGIFGVGPFHLATDDHASMMLRALPYIAIAAGMFLMIGAVVLALAGKRRPAGIRMMPLAFAAGASIMSLSATLPMGSVSELYGLGGNIGASLLLTAVVMSLWNNDATDERAIARTIAMACTGVIVAVGAYGLGSRALHFRMVWDTTDTMNRALLDFQQSLPAVPAGSTVAAGVARFPTLCLTTRTYGQYVMPPAQTINIEITAPWLARRDPARPIVFAIGPSSGAPTDRELVFDCADMPDHGHW